MRKVVILEVALKELLTPEKLPELLEKIYEAAKKEGLENVFVISGRMPVYAYAGIAHILHPCAAVSVYDPRNNYAIVVESHIQDYSVGQTIAITEDAKRVLIEF